MRAACSRWGCPADYCRPGSASADREPDPAVVRLGDLDIGEQRRGDQHPPALVVDEYEHAFVVLQRVPHRLLHRRLALGAVEHDLARRVLYTDLDLHRASSCRRVDHTVAKRSPCPPVRPLRPARTQVQRGGPAPSLALRAPALAQPWRGKCERPRQASLSNSRIASSFGTTPSVVSHQRATISDSPVSATDSSSACGRRRPVSTAIVSATASMHSREVRSTRSRTAGSLRRSVSNTSRNAPWSSGPSPTTKSK